MNSLEIKRMREQREFETRFRNPKHARAMWAKNVYDRYSMPAMEPVPILDKDGNTSSQYQLELYVWNKLKAELEAAGLDRYPSEGEMMEACQSYYARHNATAYIARRDSMGAKPVDETKNVHEMSNPYEQYSDEELEIMAKALEEHKRCKLNSPE